MRVSERDRNKTRSLVVSSRTYIKNLHTDSNVRVTGVGGPPEKRGPLVGILGGKRLGPDPHPMGFDKASSLYAESEAPGYRFL